MKQTLLTLSLLLAGTTAFGATISFTASLSGPNEAPPNASPGIGSAFITFDTSTHMMSIDVSFSGLLGTTTASHIHCCTTTAGAGTAMVGTQTPTFADFPLGVTSGTYSHTFDLTQSSSWNPAFITAHGGSISQAETDMLAGAQDGKAYLNIHTSFAPGGEIRGFLAETPEPATFGLAGLSLLGAALLRLRRRK